MEGIIVFRHENYNIAKDIRLEADVAYIQGHPIVKTKSVVLYYRGSTFRASERKAPFTNSLITDITRPQYVVELMNYLSMMINGNFLFEIYAKPPQEPKSLTDATFGECQNDDVRWPPDIDKSLYREGLLDKDARFILEALLDTMNDRFSRTFSSIEELDYVPVYGYISASETISRVSEPILHLAIVFNVLAHQDRFSGINNQEAIASFNSIMRAKRLNTTAETLNVHEYKNEIKRLQLELQRERERANGLEIAKKTLEEKVDEIQISLNQTNAQLQASAEREQHLIDEVHHAHVQRDEIQATLNETQATLNQERDANVEFRANVNQAIVDIRAQSETRFNQVSDFIADKLTGLNMTTASMTWLFIVIKRPSLTEEFRADHTIAQNQRVLDTICCRRDDKPDKLRKHEFNPVTDTIMLERPCSNALDLVHFMRRHFTPDIASCLNVRGRCARKIVYIGGAEANVIQQLEQYIATSLRVRQEIVQNLDGNQVAMRDYIDERFHQLEVHQEAQHQEAMQAIAHIQAQEQANANAIANVAEEVHDVHELVQTIAEQLQARHPNTNAILHRSRYREYHIEADGRVWCEDTKGGPRYYLTEHDIEHGRYR